MNRTRVFAIEGIDGCGKTSVVAELSKRLSNHQIPHEVISETSNVGLGNDIFNFMRTNYHGLDATSELLLILAMRKQVENTLMRDAIKHGKLVIMDRYDLSTLVYQHESYACDPLVKQLAPPWKVATFILDVSATTAMRRIQLRNELKDIFDGAPETVINTRRQLFLSKAMLLSRYVRVLDAERSIDDIVSDLYTEILDKYGYPKPDAN